MQTTEHQLRPNSLGVSDIVFFVVAAAAPLGATLGGGAAVFAIGGASAPSMYLGASLILLLFAIGFAAMSRYVVSAGGFAEMVKVGIGRHFGDAAAGIAVLSYICMLIGIYGAFSAFNAEAFHNFLGVDFSWQVGALVAILIVGVFGYLDVNISAKLLGVLMIFEVLILVIFDVAVLVQSDLSTASFSSLIPTDLTAPGFSVAFMFAFGCFVGFESTTIYGEEARNPHKTIPRATYIAIAIIGIFYTVTTWCIGLAYSDVDVQAAAGGDLVNFVFNANTKYVGAWSTSVMQILVVTSVIAVLLSFHNALCRYIFALSRSGFLFKGLSKIHSKHRSPHNASIALSLLTLVIVLVFMWADADPIANMYMWMAAVGTLGILVLQTIGSIAVISYFRKTKRAQYWQGYVAPILGGIGLFAVVLLAITNFDELSGAKSGLARFLPWLVVIAALVGVINGFFKRARPLGNANQAPT